MELGNALVMSIYLCNRFCALTCRLAEKQPGLLEELQGHAKAWSNAGLLRVVFVLSDGPALSQMKRASRTRPLRLARSSLAAQVGVAGHCHLPFVFRS